MEMVIIDPVLGDSNIVLESVRNKCPDQSRFRTKRPCEVRLCCFYLVVEGKGGNFFLSAIAAPRRDNPLKIGVWWDVGVSDVRLAVLFIKGPDLVLSLLQNIV